MQVWYDFGGFTSVSAIPLRKKFTYHHRSGLSALTTFVQASFTPSYGDLRHLNGASGVIDLRSDAAKDELYEAWRVETCALDSSVAPFLG